METVQQSSVSIAPTFRFKFDQKIMDMLLQFAKLHQYDDRFTYKEEWKKWCDEHCEELDMEHRRLSNLGYEGDIYDKLFKSGRYYFRKKPAVVPEPVIRKKYVGLNREVLGAMDSFITKEVIPSQISPAEAFTSFCSTHIDVIRKEVEDLVADHNMEANDISSKLKKTFKNRYFQLIKNTKCDVKSS